MKTLNGINQNQLATAAGCPFNKVTKLVALDVIKPIARIGTQLIFAPESVDALKAHLSAAKSGDETKYRPDFDALSAKERAEYGTFAAFCAYQKNAGGIVEHTRPGKNRPSVIMARIGGVA